MSGFIGNILRKGICKTDFIVKELNKEKRIDKITSILCLVVSALSFFCYVFGDVVSGFYFT